MSPEATARVRAISSGGVADIGPEDAARVPGRLPLVAAEPALAPAMVVETVSDYEALLALGPAWNRLVDEAEIDHPFLRHEWIVTWWESFGTGKQLHVLVVKANGEPVAIAPLMLWRGPLYGLMVRRLELIANVHSQRADFIVGRWADEVYRALWDCLARQRGMWDVLVLPQLPAGSPTLTSLPRLAAVDGCRSGIWPSTDSPCLSLRGTFEAYLGGLARKHRSNLRNRLKRLGQVGEVALEVVSHGPQLGEAFEEGLRLEALAWKGRAGTAIRCHSELHLFYGRLAARAARRDWLRLHFLTVGARRIAFAYMLCFKKRLFLLKPGYDPAYAAYSPSSLLLYMVLCGAFAAGIDAFEFLGEKDAWKLDWTSAVRPHSWLFVFTDTPRSRLLHFAKFRLLPRIKRVWRAAHASAARLGRRSGSR